VENGTVWSHDRWPWSNPHSQTNWKNQMTIYKANGKHKHCSPAENAFRAEVFFKNCRARGMKFDPKNKRLRDLLYKVKAFSDFYTDSLEYITVTFAPKKILLTDARTRTKLAGYLDDMESLLKFGSEQLSVMADEFRRDKIRLEELESDAKMATMTNDESLRS
jgi:hypothetical protein